MTQFSASARWISSIWRLYNGLARSAPAISAPMIGVYLSTLMVSYGADSSAIWRYRGPLLPRKDVIAVHSRYGLEFRFVHSTPERMPRHRPGSSACSAWRSTTADANWSYRD